MPAKLTAGDVREWQRTFTMDDVASFARVSGDAGAHHRVPDERGRVMVQGLLTATLPTKLGGDLDFIAREMSFEFVRPVWSGDTIRCELRIVQVSPEAGRTRVRLSGTCHNQDGEEVLRFRSEGIVLAKVGE
jgi:3-hydroxybutyryl-CoA dehydratase